MSLDPWIIEEELKKQKRQQERPQIQLPIPEYEPMPPKKDAPVERVVVIQL